MPELNVPVYDAKVNSNLYAGVTGGAVIGYNKSGTTIPIAGGTIGYEYKDKNNGGAHAGLSVTAGTTFTGMANVGYELRWGDFGLDLSAKAKGTMSNISEQQSVSLDSSEQRVNIDELSYVDIYTPAVKVTMSYKPFDYNAGLSSEFVYHGRTEKADFNLAAGVEAGYHGAGPSAECGYTEKAHVKIDENRVLDVIKAENVSLNGNRRTPWYVTPTLRADATFGKNKSWTVKLDADMYEAKAGIVYNIPVGKDK